MNELAEILLPLGVSVVLPVFIVWLVTRARQNEINKKTEIMLKAIESGVAIDANLFNEQKGSKTIKERFIMRLAGGCIFALMGIFFTVIGFLNRDATTSIFGGVFFAIGIGLLIVFFVGKKMMAREMEAEAKEMEKK